MRKSRWGQPSQFGKVHLEGNTDFEQQPFIPGSKRSGQADFEFPWTAVLGVSYRPTPKWNLEFDADYTDWSSFGKTTIYQTPAPPCPMQTECPRDTRLAGELDV